MLEMATLSLKAERNYKKELALLPASVPAWEWLSLDFSNPLGIR